MTNAQVLEDKGKERAERLLPEYAPDAITMEREFLSFCDRCGGRVAKKSESYIPASVTLYIPDSLKHGNGGFPSFLVLFI